MAQRSNERELVSERMSEADFEMTARCHKHFCDDNAHSARISRSYALFICVVWSCSDMLSVHHNLVCTMWLHAYFVIAYSAMFSRSFLLVFVLSRFETERQRQ